MMTARTRWSCISGEALFDAVLNSPSGLAFSVDD
jgi:hypothetical protein